MLKVQEIREIIKLIDESSINEFTYETNGSKVVLKKADDTQTAEKIKQVLPVDQPVVEMDKKESEQVKEIHKKTVAEELEDEPKSTVAYDHEIVSPMVGTFYQSPSPESEPYIVSDSEVQEETIVCIVEAMKLFNEIEAEVSGKIVEILVEDGELVEYGQPLFRVKKK